MSEAGRDLAGSAPAPGRPVVRGRTAAAIIVLLLAGCASTPRPSAPLGATPTPSADTSAATAPFPSGEPSAAAAPRELTTGSGRLPAGTYTASRFRPPVTFALDDGWVAGTVDSGFFDVQQDRGTPDVIAVQFARVAGIVGAGGSMSTPTTAAAAAKALHENPALVVIDEGPSRLDGLGGLDVTIENRGASTASVMRVSAGTLGFDPKRRLRISLFDTPDGVLGVMVGGSVAKWDRTLAVAQPVLESVAVGR
jgi:hypothetical protein